MTARIRKLLAPKPPAPEPQPVVVLTSSADLAQRREQARVLFSKGLTPSQVARELGVHRNNAAKWKRILDAGGTLDPTPKTGRRQRLQRVLITRLIECGARTPTSLAESIQMLYGLHYSVSYCGLLIRRHRAKG